MMVSTPFFLDQGVLKMTWARAVFFQNLYILDQGVLKMTWATKSPGL